MPSPLDVMPQGDDAGLVQLLQRITNLENRVSDFQATVGSLGVQYISSTLTVGYPGISTVVVGNQLIPYGQNWDPTDQTPFFPAVTVNIANQQLASFSVDGVLFGPYNASLGKYPIQITDGIYLTYADDSAALDTGYTAFNVGQGGIEWGHYNPDGPDSYTSDWDIAFNVISPENSSVPSGSGHGLVMQCTPGGNSNYGRITLGQPWVSDGSKYGVDIIGNGGIRMNGNNDDASYVIISNKVTAVPVYATTTSSAANVNIASDGTLARSTSASKYKLDIQTKDYGDAVLQLDPQDWIDKAAHDAGLPDVRVPGLVAEDVASKGLTDFVVYENSEIEGLMYDRLWVTLIPIVRDLRDRITKLESANAPTDQS